MGWAYSTYSILISIQWSIDVKNNNQIVSYLTMPTLSVTLNLLINFYPCLLNIPWNAEIHLIEIYLKAYCLGELKLHLAFQGCQFQVQWCNYLKHIWIIFVISLPTTIYNGEHLILATIILLQRVYIYENVAKTPLKSGCNAQLP